MEPIEFIRNSKKTFNLEWRDRHTHIDRHTDRPFYWVALCATNNVPLHIVIALVRLSSWETVNWMDCNGNTALDWAVLFNNRSAALYFSWLGAECKRENRKYRGVTLLGRGYEQADLVDYIVYWDNLILMIFLFWLRFTRHMSLSRILISAWNADDDAVVYCLL